MTLALNGKSKTRRTWLLAMAVAMLAFAAFAGAGTLSSGGTARAAGPWYVDPAGNDANTCLAAGAATACKTIQGAIGKASSGDTISVAAGTYYESNIIVNKAVTIDGQDRAGVVVAPSMVDGHIDGGFIAPVSNGFVIQHSDVKIQDLTINGNGNTGLSGTQNYRAGVITDYTSGHFDRTVVTNVSFKNIWRRGLAYYVNDGSSPTTGNEISNSSFDNIGTDPALGGSGNAITIGQSSGTVSNNTITNSNTGIVTNFINQHPSYAPTIHIVGNHISSLVSNSWGALGMNLSGLSRDSVVENNTVDLSGLTVGIQDMGVIIYWTSAYPTDPADLNHLTLSNNQVIHAGGGDIGIEISRQSFMNPSIPEVAVTGNTVSGTGGDTGILVTDWPSGYSDSSVSEAVNATLTGNHVSGFSTNIDLANLGTANVMVTFGAGNTMTDGGTGLRIRGANVSIVGNRISQNSFVGNTQFGVNNQTVPTIDATCNWWGAANGPGPVGPGSGDKVSSNVTYRPWLTTSNLPGPCNGGAPVTSKDQCNNGGWAIAVRADYTTFKNQGDCVSYTNKGN